MSEEARRFAEQYGGIWGEHPQWPVGDWRLEVTNDDTRASYWDWVIAQVELTEEP